MGYNEEGIDEKEIHRSVVLKNFGVPKVRSNLCI